MSPRDEIAELYRRYPQPRSLEEDEEIHRVTGYVIEGRDFYLMGRGVWHDARHEDIVNPSVEFGRAIQTAWFIYAFSGNISRIDEVKPYRLPLVGWARRNGRVRWYTAEKALHRVSGVILFRALRFLPLLLALLMCGCARTDFYYPATASDVVYDEKGRPKISHRRAIVLNGSDSLGATHVRITANSLEFSNQGGIDNSTSTREGYRTVRHGVGTAAGAAVLGIGLSQAGSAYSANQAAAATSNAAASRAAAATAASKGATTVRLAEIEAARQAAAAAASRAIPAANSVIPAVVPATVVPVP